MRIDAELFEDRPDNPLGLLKQGDEKMLDVDVGVLEPLGDLLSVLDRLLSAKGKFVEAHIVCESYRLK